jgi:hypothetical protein
VVDVENGSLLFKREVPINDNIKVIIPTVGEILEDEASYETMTLIFTAAPIDFMVQLDDMGIDFTEINDWELFVLFFNGLKTMDTSLLLGDLDLTRFELYVNNENGDLVLLDEENDIKIDRLVYEEIGKVLREINGLKKNNKKPGNEEAKRYMLERARVKQRRNMRKKRVSQLEKLIVALVNTEQFKYNFETVKDISIYQFNKSFEQVVKKIDFDNLMYGVYTGSVDIKEISQDRLTWIS